MKNFAFINEAAHRSFMALPKALRIQFGLDLYAIQNGQPPFSPCKDISASVGKGAIELKRNGSPAYRAIYCATYRNTVFVLHAFSKTTNGVDRVAMKTAAARYKEIASLDRAQKTLQKKNV